jgi:(S)-2-hydroxyglutarate dehydrogenase
MSGTQSFDITVVGGGIVGLASAYKLSLRFPELSILVLEKESTLASHQTGHNSGVIHSGLYYKPGSYRAKNCVDGRRELVAFAREHKIPHDICGKIVVAVNETELPNLDKIYNNGIENGVEGVEYISAEQIKEIEPYCTGIKGLFISCTGIIDFCSVANKYAELVSAKEENTVLTGHEVKEFIHENSGIKIVTNKGNFYTNYLVTCGGLQSDRLATKAGVKPDTRIIGFRGDYYELTHEAQYKVKNLIYPVPNPKFPFLGVHFTRMIQGGVECGPNAVFVFKREGYGKFDFDFRDTAEALSFGGTWKFFYKHWKFGIDEYKRALSKKLFIKRLRKLIPSLEMHELEPGRAGVRAMALGAEGEMIDDFRFEVHGNALHVLNAPSPAATASLAIGKAVTDMAEKHFRLKEKV